MALTPRQEAFVQEYLRDLNGTQAAIRAGYSHRTANEQAARLLVNVSVAEAVARAKAERAARAGIDADRVLEEIKAVALADLTDYAEWGPGHFELYDSHEDVPGTNQRRAAIDGRAVKGVTIKEITITNDHGEIRKVEQGIALHDKLGALEKLCRHLGIAVEKRDMTIGNREGETFNVEVRPVDYRKALGAFLPPADGDDD